ncbi:MAG TPA: response regulator [Burkholderiaceae bacterium]|nr:response regulator [Burkholderiaceae bacterium]
MPFALVYLLDAAGLRATLCGAAGLRAGTAMAPRTVELLAPHAVWPLGRAVRQGGPQQVDGLAVLLRNFHSTTWDETPQSAMVLPLQMARGETGALLVVGISPRQAFDDVYRGFVDGIAQHVATNLAEAQLRERDRERIEQLALMDRARTEFFSNVSHEFRTPLTLILAPLEDMLSVSDAATGPLRRELEVAQRNAHRLFNLVDTLLDFSRIEAGRLQARFRPVDLSALTIDICSLFRSAAERAGLELAVDCPPAPEWIAVDADMWEKVLSNLLSNALKFTFEGRISVRLRYLPQHVQLEVSDTGVGIPADQQGHVFSRVHRVRGMRARTDDGLGLGLSIVSELTRLHHGRVRVRSAPGEGSTFTVWIRSHLPVWSSESAAASHAPERSVASQLADEAGTWSKARPGEVLPVGIVESMIRSAGPALPVPASGSLVLVVDDNADMRDYLARTLASYWRVEMACDGAEALVRARARRPDLIVADVMMPVLDGFGLLRELRSDNELKATPVVLVTARAHEEAAIDGLLAGADDYVSKPFSSRELVARIGAQLELARLRRRGERQVRDRLAGMPVGVYACDTQGRFSYWNRRAMELWEGEPGNDDRAWALLGAPQALTPDGAWLAPDASAMAEVLRTGEAVQDQEVAVVTAAGSRLDLLMNIRPLREDGTLVGAVCAFLDVTARKVAERAVRTMNDELEERGGRRAAQP